MTTLFLNPQTWDLCLDDQGNIAYAKKPYAKAQDVASAIKLFKGELYYDTEKGMPYFDETLGRKQSLALYQYRLEQAALTVKGVKSAKANIESDNDRQVVGSVTFTDNQDRMMSVKL